MEKFTYISLIFVLTNESTSIKKEVEEDKMKKMKKMYKISYVILLILTIIFASCAEKKSKFDHKTDSGISIDGWYETYSYGGGKLHLRDDGFCLIQWNDFGTLPMGYKKIGPNKIIIYTEDPYEEQVTAIVTESGLTCTDCTNGARFIYVRWE